MKSGLSETVKQRCEALLKTPVEASFRLEGGNINEARWLETSKGRFFLKTNAAAPAHAMFATEAKGLQLLAKSHTLRVPEVIGFSTPNDDTPGWLLLEFIESGVRRSDFWARFGEGLADLHRHRHENFGLESDNFIGRLSQSNQPHKKWTTFYVEERLLAQLQIPEAQHLFTTTDHDHFERLFHKLPSILPEEPPALIHGDLWNGNFLSDEHGIPVLIDPAVCFASREMDIAMSLLFGGFAQEFYQAYQHAYPLLPGWQERIELYQLYYLLVHVNLFGGGYIQSVRQIVRRFV